MGNRARWLMRWSGKATARLHLGEYKNCEHIHIPLPAGKEKIEIIFILPPDPLHCILLGEMVTKYSLNIFLIISLFQDQSWTSLES